MNDFRVQFDQPDLVNLKKKYTVVDMHFHSNYSDGFNTIKAIASRAKSLDIAIAITDHNAIQGALDIDKFKDVLSIPGIEVTSREGTHVLVYFYDTSSLKKFYTTEIKPHLGDDVMSSTKLRMEEIIQRARKYKCVIIFPHPYSAGYTGIYNSHFNEKDRKQLFKFIDGFEAINAENLHRWNLKSSLLALNFNKAITGGSDGHTLAYMGKVVTCIKCKPTRKSILDNILKGNTIIIGKELNLFRRATSNGYKMRMNIKNYPELVEKNIAYSYRMINKRANNIKQHVGTKIRILRNNP